MSGGRPTKRTEANRAAILLALGRGVTRKGAAAVAGMHYDTLATWVADDPEFSDECTRAEHRAEDVYVALIEKAAIKDWRAAAWMLERRRHEDYGQRSRVDMTVDVEGAVKRVAAENGLDEGLLLAEAERILSESRR